MRRDRAALPDERPRGLVVRGCAGRGADGGRAVAGDRGRRGAPGAAAESDEELLAFARRPAGRLSSELHVRMAGCGGAVDPRLRLRGVTAAGWMLGVPDIPVCTSMRRAERGEKARADRGGCAERIAPPPLHTAAEFFDRRIAFSCLRPGRKPPVCWLDDVRGPPSRPRHEAETRALYHNPCQYPGPRAEPRWRPARRPIRAGQAAR